MLMVSCFCSSRLQNFAFYLVIHNCKNFSDLLFGFLAMPRYCLFGDTGKSRSPRECENIRHALAANIRLKLRLSFAVNTASRMCSNR